MTTFTGTPVTSTRLVTLTEVKAQLRLDSDDTSEDDLLNLYIDAAVEKIESDTRKSFLTKTYTWYSDNFPEPTADNHFGYIELPYSPVVSVTSVAYTDDSGDSQTFTDFSVANSYGKFAIYPDTSWPSVTSKPNCVTITYTAGYGEAASSSPVMARQATLLLVGHWYENREGTSLLTVKDVPYTYMALTNKIKRWE